MNKTGIFIIGLLVSCPVWLNGQDESQVKDWFDEGEYYFYSEDYLDALNFYLQIDDTRFTNANIKHRIGLCYFFSETDYDKAIDYLKQSVQNIADKYREGNFKEKAAPLEALFYLGKSYQYTSQLDSALVTFHDLRQRILEREELNNLLIINNEIQKCHNAINDTKDPRQVKFIEPGELINNQFSNTHVTVSPGGKKMAYISKRKFYDAFFYTEFENNRWGPPMNITPQIGSDGKYYPCSFSHDGNLLFMFRKEDLGVNIYYTEFDSEENQWGKARRINNRSINTIFGEPFASLSPDSTTLYFASYRDKGIGGLDIYRAHLNELGIWEGVENLGSSINTPFDENNPVISPDGSTLYFISKGHYNIGGYDIFYSEMDSAGNWGTPVNLGYPVNSTRDEDYFSPSFDDAIGYISRYDREQKKNNIYKILPVESMEMPLISIKGRFLNEEEEIIEVPGAQVFITDKAENEKAEISPDSTRKGFTYRLLPGEYTVSVESRRYEPVEKELELPETKADSSMQLPIKLKRRGQEYTLVSLTSILFGFDQDSLTEASLTALDEVAEIMQKNKDFKLQITEHTDHIGSQDYNKKLSMRRSQRAAEYLISAGIDSSRLVIKGVASDSSIARNTLADGSDNPEGRKYNRRVDFRLLNPGANYRVRNRLRVPDYLDKETSQQYTVLLPGNTTAENREQIQTFKREINEYLTPYGKIYYVGKYNTKSEASAVKEAIEEKQLAAPRIIQLYQLEDYISGKERYHVIYTIQLAAMQQQVDSTYFSVDPVSMREGEYGLIRYTTGEYNSYQQARSKLKEIKASGYPKAFIINVEEGP